MRQEIVRLADGRIPTANELYKMLAEDGVTGAQADEIVRSQAGVRARARTAEAAKVGGGGLRGAAILAAELICAAAEPGNPRRLFECRQFGSGMRSLRDGPAWTVSLQYALVKCVTDAGLNAYRLVICFHEVAGLPELHEPPRDFVLVLAAYTAETRRMHDYVRFDETLCVRSLIRFTDVLLAARNGNFVENMPAVGVPLDSPFGVMDLPADRLAKTNQQWCELLAADNA